MNAAQDRAARQAMAERLPWVKHNRRPAPCDGIKWSKVPLKALFSRGGKPAEGLDDPKYHCTKPAYWSFKSLKKSYAKDGTYCWSHLIYSGIYGDMIEEKRANDWFRDHPVSND